MRYITVFCLIFVLECTCETVIKLESGKAAKVIESAVKCTAKHDFNLNIFERLRNKDGTKDEMLLKFYYCILEDLKMVTENGYFIEEEVLKSMREPMQLSKFKKLLKKHFLQQQKQ